MTTGDNATHRPSDVDHLGPDVWTRCMQWAARSPHVLQAFHSDLSVQYDPDKLKQEGDGDEIGRRFAEWFQQRIWAGLNEAGLRARQPPQ